MGSVWLCQTCWLPTKQHFAPDHRMPQIKWWHTSLPWKLACTYTRVFHAACISSSNLDKYGTDRHIGTEAWREALESASVVNKCLVPDPTIRQPGFDLPRRSWSLLIAFRQARDSAMQICSNGVCLYLTYANVVNPRRWPTLSTRAHAESSLAGWWSTKAPFCRWLYAITWLNSVAKEALAKWKIYAINLALFRTVCKWIRGCCSCNCRIEWDAADAADGEVTLRSLDALTCTRVDVNFKDVSELLYTFNSWRLKLNQKLSVQF